MAVPTFTFTGDLSAYTGVELTSYGSVIIRGTPPHLPIPAELKVLVEPPPIPVEPDGTFTVDLAAVEGVVYTVSLSPRHLFKTFTFDAQPEGTTKDLSEVLPVLAASPMAPYLVGPKGDPGTPADRAGQGVTPLLDPAEELVGTDPWPVGVLDGVLWGAKADHSLHRSTDSGATWVQEEVVTAATSAIQRLWPLGNGEVLVHAFGQLIVSTGWTSNPAAVTWAQVLTTAPRVTYFTSWSVDVKGSRVIAAEYDVYANQPWRCWVSTDYGQTFALSLDLETVRDAGQLAHTHWHAVAVDTFRGLLWATNGDEDDTNQLWWSDDDGATWNALTAPLAKKRITAILPMAEGILLGSDDGSNIGPPGVWRINPDDFNDITIVHTIESGLEGLPQIGASAHTAPDGTGYMCFASFLSQGGPSVIVASTTGRSVSEVWRDPTPTLVGNERKIYAISGPDGNGVMHGRITSTLHTGWHLTATAPKAGVTQSQRPVLAGDGDVRAGLAIGLASSAGVQSVAAGDGATAGKGNENSQRSTAFGYQATAGAAPDNPFGSAFGALARALATGASAFGYDAEALQGALAMGQSSRAGDSATAIGPNSEATAQLAVALGSGALAEFFAAVVLGAFADTEGPDTVGVGYSAYTVWKGTALGAFARALGFGSVALGHSAVASHADSAAIGSATLTSAANQVAMGPRHIELEESSDPGAAPANKGRPFLRDNGSGKGQLCIQFATGGPVVIATEL